MPRSNKIYIVVNHAEEILACFTVKHEAFAWIDRNWEDYEPDKNSLFVISTPDGRDYSPQYVAPS